MTLLWCPVVLSRWWTQNVRDVKVCIIEDLLFLRPNRYLGILMSTKCLCRISNPFLFSCFPVGGPRPTGTSSRALWVDWWGSSPPPTFTATSRASHTSTTAWKSPCPTWMGRGHRGSRGKADMSRRMRARGRRHLGEGAVPSNTKCSSEIRVHLAGLYLYVRRE